VSDKILAVIDTEVTNFAELKEQLQSIRDNFLSLQKDSLRGAAQVLALTPLAANFTVTTATYSTVGLKTSITTSGGLLMLFGITTLDFGAGVAVIGTQLTLDDETKSESKGADAAQASIPNFWAGEVGKGVHVIDLQYKAIAGTPTPIGGLTNTTFLCAVEFLI
jgi:hypothetical protein